MKQVSRCPPLRYGAELSSLAMSGLASSVARSRCSLSLSLSLSLSRMTHSAPFIDFRGRARPRPRPYLVFVRTSSPSS